MQPQPKLHLARRIARGRSANTTEGRWCREGQRRISHHHVIQNVGELEAEICAPAFAEEVDGLIDAQVQVPARQAAQNIVAAATGVIAEDALSELADHRGRVGEHVDAGGVVGADSAGSRDGIVVSRVAARIGGRRHGILLS